ncbi:hypothetical protein B566_EDAN016161 [Ephemera danica]|nr:hypothetical protein B566_EDAN016161 [Ephemera danica]
MMVGDSGNTLDFGPAPHAGELMGQRTAPCISMGVTGEAGVTVRMDIGKRCVKEGIDHKERRNTKAVTREPSLPPKRNVGVGSCDSTANPVTKIELLSTASYTEILSRKLELFLPSWEHLQQLETSLRRDTTLPIYSHTQQDLSHRTEVIFTPVSRKDRNIGELALQTTLQIINSLPPHSILIYTDGSKSGNSVGSGFYSPQCRLSKGFKLPQFANCFKMGNKTKKHPSKFPKKKRSDLRRYPSILRHQDKIKRIADNVCDTDDMLLAATQDQEENMVTSCNGSVIAESTSTNSLRDFSKNTSEDMPLAAHQEQDETMVTTNNGSVIAVPTYTISMPVFSKNTSEAAVAGTMCAGGGYQLLKDFCIAINMPIMSSATYQSHAVTLSPYWEKAALLEMEKAGEEEHELALKDGDVDSDGTPIITVAADGSWPKRSFKSKYDSLSGRLTELSAPKRGQAKLGDAASRKLVGSQVANIRKGYHSKNIEETQKNQTIRARKRKQEKKNSGIVTKRKKITHGTTKPDMHYNRNTNKLPMSTLELKRACSQFITDLTRSADERAQIETDTKLQLASGGKWLALRRNFLTSSRFGEVCKLRPTTRIGRLVGSVLNNCDDNNASRYDKNVHLLYGVNTEETAKEKLEEVLGVEIEKCGLVIDPDIPYLAASPDGKIGDDALIEIKCPSVARDMTINEGIEKKKIPYLSLDPLTNNREFELQQDFLLE